MKTFKIINQTTGELIKEYINPQFSQWKEMVSTVDTLNTSPNWKFQLRYN